MIRILPNRYELKSTLNPLDTEVMKTPIAKDVDAIKPIAASPPMRFSSLNFKINNDAKLTIGIEMIKGD